MYEFPDVERAIREVVEQVTDNVVLFLPADFHERVPIVLVTMVPSIGGGEEFLRTDRVQIDVYGDGRTQARSIAEAIRRAVVGSHDTAAGLLDDVYVETEPHEEPYPHDTVSLFSATYRADTRAL